MPNALPNHVFCCLTRPGETSGQCNTALTSLIISGKQMIILLLNIFLTILTDPDDASSTDSAESFAGFDDGSNADDSSSDSSSE